MRPERRPDPDPPQTSPGSSELPGRQKAAAQESLRKPERHAGEQRPEPEPRAPLSGHCPDESAEYERAATRIRRSDDPASM